MVLYCNVPLQDVLEVAVVILINIDFFYIFPALEEKPIFIGVMANGILGFVL